MGRKQFQAVASTLGSLSPWTEQGLEKARALWIAGLSHEGAAAQQRLQQERGCGRVGLAVLWQHSSLCMSLSAASPQGLECLPDVVLTVAQASVVGQF